MPPMQQWFWEKLGANINKKLEVRSLELVLKPKMAEIMQWPYMAKWPIH